MPISSSLSRFFFTDTDQSIRAVCWLLISLDSPLPAPPSPPMPPTLVRETMMAARDHSFFESNPGRVDGKSTVSGGAGRKIKGGPAGF
uniref:Uncharacterized protein n=1 Tax=Oryza sativa subsp. japonica TaxID=39947 RepID=Q67VG8_ORYSJ|nr:hypothetical protein [Oryza sativa Japonica Group]